MQGDEEATGLSPVSHLHLAGDMDSQLSSNVGTKITVYSTAFSAANGGRIVSGDSSGLVIVWDVSGARVLAVASG